MNADMPELAKWNNFYVIVGFSCGNADRIAVRRANPDCRQTTREGRGGRYRVRQSDERSLQRRIAFVGASACTVVNDHYGCIVLCCGFRWGGVYRDRDRDRDRTYAKATGIQTTI